MRTQITSLVTQVFVFSPNLLKPSSEASQRELETVPGFIIDGRSLINTRLADDTVLMEDTQRKVHDILYSVV